jgi:hypothetical protein
MAVLATLLPPMRGFDSCMWLAKTLRKLTEMHRLTLCISRAMFLSPPACESPSMPTLVLVGTSRNEEMGFTSHPVHGLMPDIESTDHDHIFNDCGDCVHRGCDFNLYDDNYIDDNIHYIDNGANTKRANSRNSHPTNPESGICSTYPTWE